jgi:two-component system response regulator RegA
MQPVDYLVIDDDPAFTAVLRDALLRRNHSVMTAADGAQTRLLLEKRAARRVILDLRLEQESGLKLISELKSRLPEMEIVVLTGYSSIATAVEAIRLGARNYICKPADTDEIIAAFASTPTGDTPLQPNPPSVQRLEWEHIQSVLNQHSGNISASARSLGMHRRTLQRKLQKYPVKN